MKELRIEPRQKVSSKGMANCPGTDYRDKPCHNKSCRGCLSVARAKRILGEFPLDAAWIRVRRSHVHEAVKCSR